MRHGYFGRKLSRTKNERRRLFMVLMRSLIVHGRIRTTEAKAKAIAPEIDRLITALKKKSSAGLSEVRKTLSNESVVTTLRDMVKTRFAGRTSGYTRIIKLGKRRGDSAEVVVLEFVDPAPKPKKEPVTGTAKPKKSSKKAPTVQEAEVVSDKSKKKPKKKRVLKKK